MRIGYPRQLFFFGAKEDVLGTYIDANPAMGALVFIYDRWHDFLLTFGLAAIR